jgi:hypothetical protein
MMETGVWNREKKMRFDESAEIPLDEPALAGGIVVAPGVSPGPQSAAIFDGSLNSSF